MRPSNASKNDDLKLDVKPNVGIIQIPCSRPCVRGDAINRFTTAEVKIISTHAPA